MELTGGGAVGAEGAVHEVADTEFLQLEGLHADGSDLSQGVGTYNAACATVEGEGRQYGRTGSVGAEGEAVVTDCNSKVYVR